MAIQKSNTYSKVKVGGVSVSTQLWECHCDSCDAVCKAAIDAGQAHEFAEKAGWKPQSNKWFNPLKWFCSTCLTKQSSNGKSKVVN